MENLVKMKKLTLLLLTLLYTNIAFSQKEKGILNLGIGVGNGGLRINSVNYDGYNSRVSTPALGISYEIPVHPDITVGPYLGFNRETLKRTQFPEWEYNKKSSTNIWFGGKGAYYFDNLLGLNDEFDFYAGATLGFSYSNIRETSDVGSPTLNSTTLLPNFGLFIGGRYWFKDNFAAYAETGLGVSWLNLGISLKM